MALEDGENVGITLWITSLTLDPQAITRQIGLEPNYVQIRGTPAGRTSRLYERHSWSLGKRLYAKPNESLSHLTAPFISQFLDSLETSVSSIHNLSTEHCVSIAIIFGAWDMPHVGLTQPQVAAIAALGASVNYDIMTYRTDD